MWYFLTDVSGQPMGLILRVQEFTTARCVITQTSAVLSYFATEAWNHAVCFFVKMVRMMVGKDFSQPFSIRRISFAPWLGQTAVAVCIVQTELARHTVGMQLLGRMGGGGPSSSDRAVKQSNWIPAQTVSQPQEYEPSDRGGVGRHPYETIRVLWITSA